MKKFYLKNRFGDVLEVMGKMSVSFPLNMVRISCKRYREEKGRKSGVFFLTCIELIVLLGCVQASLFQLLL